MGEARRRKILGLASTPRPVYVESPPTPKRIPEIALEILLRTTEGILLKQKAAAADPIKTAEAIILKQKAAVDPKVGWSLDPIGRTIAASMGRDPRDCSDEMGDGLGAMLRAAVRRYPFPVQPDNLGPYPLAGWAEMASEVIAINKREELGWAVTGWQKAQLELMEGLLDWAGRDWFNDEISDAAKEKIRNAGRLLNEMGGYSEMHNTCSIWTPREMHREIEYLWDGIGTWKA
jgi:hypothetical protein